MIATNLFISFTMYHFSFDSSTTHRNRVLLAQKQLNYYKVRNTPN